MYLAEWSGPSPDAIVAIGDVLASGCRISKKGKIKDKRGRKVISKHRWIKADVLDVLSRPYDAMDYTWIVVQYASAQLDGKLFAVLLDQPLDFYDDVREYFEGMAYAPTAINFCVVARLYVYLLGGAFAEWQSGTPEGARYLEDKRQVIEDAKPPPPRVHKAGMIRKKRR